MMRLKPSLPPVGFSKVLETFKIKQIEIWQVWLDLWEGNNKETLCIETTSEHPFYIQSLGFIPVISLIKGMFVVTALKQQAIIQKVIKLSEKNSVFNFSVAHTHTYFISKSGVWVHNPCGMSNIQSTDLNNEIGRGSFGVAYKFSHNGEDLVAKLMHEPTSAESIEQVVSVLNYANGEGYASVGMLDNNTNILISHFVKGEAITGQEAFDAMTRKNIMLFDPEQPNVIKNALGDYSLIDADQAYVTLGIDNLPENIKHHNQYLLATAPTGGYQTYYIYGKASWKASRNPRGYYKICNR